ncbi:MAG: BPSS1780 family membrane protein [Casimicrobiaceae bacterium]|nr:BPSS1780 family membrane protein [Casimicrobiaceae bacterium]MCX8098912.1 BPSS1780 family membrane protein [Casimicrobiaceae bacterium]MDW8312926.1 BPSS1780 family membrane protein [Burkholderiales bacterium]
MALPQPVVVPAREGAQWLAASFALFRVYWFRYVALAALFLLLMQLLSLVTAGLGVMLLKPILSVGFLAAAWHHERGELPEVMHLFAGFRSNWKALIPLGGVYLLGVILTASLAAAVTGLDIEALMAGKGPELSDPIVTTFMLVTILLMLPVTAALWFAPALVVFGDASFPAALRLSLIAWWRNLPAMAVYGVALIGSLFVLVLLLSPLLMLLGASRTTPVLMLAALPVTAIVMISDYVSYRAVFHRHETLKRVDR